MATFFFFLARLIDHEKAWKHTNGSEVLGAPGYMNNADFGKTKSSK